MKKNYKDLATLVLVAAVVLTSAAALYAQDYKAIIGAWDVELTAMGMTFELIFKMEEGEIKGEMNFDMGSAELSDITLEGDKLTFIANIDAGGQAMTIEAMATVKGDEMNGTMSSDMGEAEFTGTRREG